MDILFLAVIVTTLTVSQSLTDCGSIVALDDGRLQGITKTSYDGRQYLSFEGIPYAKAPIGKLRYTSPQPVHPWAGTLIANTTYTCLQNSFFVVLGVEDCLYLNVYVPRLSIEVNENLAVLVYFHGGAFAFGSPSTDGGPRKLMDRDIILVTVNYRLGALGFLSVGDQVIPGNYGLKDQAFSLQWVKNNIHKFGGNPNSVTITGVSAGGASVHLHYFSPLSKCLFHRGFAQSGSAFDPWAINRQPRVYADVYLNKVGCLFDTSDAILECLQNATANGLVQTYGELYAPGGLTLPLVLFGPVVEDNSEGAFLHDEPYRQIISKSFHDVPLLLSVTTEEGIMPSIMKVNQLDDLNNNWNKWGPLLLNYMNLEEKEKSSLSSQIKQDYFNNSDITKDNFNILVDLCTTRLFHWGTQNTSLLQGSVSKSSVYLFKMGFGPEHSIYEALFNISIPGVAHGDDLVFYYDIAMSSNNNLNEKEERMKNVLLDMVFSFVTTNVPVIPNVDWKPVTQEHELTYLLVRGPEQMEIVTKLVGPNLIHPPHKKHKLKHH